MGKYPIYSAKSLTKLLQLNGCNIVRQKGSHIVMQRVQDQKTYTIVIPDHKEIKIGTLTSIIRQSGLDKTLFEFKD